MSNESEQQLTQEKIDEQFKTIQEEWNKLVEKSGRTEEMAVILGGKEISSFLYCYQMAKESVEAEGLVMPELVKGLTTTIK